MKIQPITFKQACDFVNRFHRHHKVTVECKFCIGLFDADVLIGIAVCGWPVSRYLDNGLTCEINRLCVIYGYYNACSKLCRIVKEMGCEKIITYTIK
nr:MAG TPA: hypothetical protein [Caudoviricetes sp.]